MRTRLAAEFSPLSAVTCRPVATRGPPGADNRGPIDQQGRLYQECSAFDAPVVARLKHRPRRAQSQRSAALGPSRLGRRAPGEGVEMRPGGAFRSEEHTSELQSLMRLSYDVFCCKKKQQQ